MSKIKFTRGTDPEFFLKKADKYISAIPFIEGTKYEPAPLPSGGTIQRDNVAMEFATDPAGSAEEFVDKIKRCLSDACKLIPEDCEIAVDPSADFEADQLDHPEALEFGCDPDYNAWSIEENEKPWCGDSGFRSCGAHIHVGGLDSKGRPMKGLEFLQEFQGKIRMVRAMDLLHGIISTVLDRGEASIKRRKLYGKAGAHRPTEYGVEYRVLSNYWMKSPSLVMLMDALTGEALRLIQTDKDKELIELLGEEEIQDMINKGDVETATRVIEKYIRPELSPTTLDMLDMCMEKVNTYKGLKAEWGI